MATATVPRNDVYLSILAGRVLTALADLARDPFAWSERIQRELESGIEYCQAIRGYQPVSLAAGGVQGRQALRRVANDEGRERPETQPVSDCDDAEALLRDLLARSRQPEPAELLAAIKFFSKDVG